MQKETDMSMKWKSDKDCSSPAPEWLLQLKDQPSLQFSWKIGKQGHLLSDPWDDSIPFCLGIVEINWEELCEYLARMCLKSLMDIIQWLFTQFIFYTLNLIFSIYWDHSRFSASSVTILPCTLVANFHFFCPTLLYIRTFSYT